MKIPKKLPSATRSKLSTTPISNGIEPRLPHFEKNTRDEVAPFDGEMRDALSKNLHELLNSLWPAAARIELAVTEATCPPEFRETLEQLGRCVEEAMAIAAHTSELVDLQTHSSPL